MKIIRERQTTEEIKYNREFTDASGNGFIFPCEIYGELLNDDAMESYNDCINGLYKDSFTDRGIVEDRCYHTQPAIGICDCGREIQLVSTFMGATSCECGKWYNMFGQSVVSPKYWED